MIVIGNYSIIQYAKANKIVICLPQTEQSATNTITPADAVIRKLREMDGIENRRYKLTNDELSKLLMYVISMIKDGAE